MYHDDMLYSDDVAFLREKLAQLVDSLNRAGLENDRMALQLEQRKTQLALNEEKRASNELKMKLEIRYLLVVDHFPAGKQLSYLRSVNGQKE
jgi:hypothetical protein